MCPTSPRPPGRGGPSWAAHLREIAAIEFFLVPTLTFLLFIFVVLRHDGRKLIHLTVTDHPTAAWTAQQLVEALPNDTAPGICSVIETGSTGKPSRGASHAWGSARL
jgi:hypothetical protein